MQNRIDSTFQSLRGRGQRALVTFVTAGDPFPTVEGTADLLVALAEAGSDIVELGVPYSDPMADGPTIQASSQRALDRGMTPLMVLEIVKAVRRRSNVPIVLMGYYNTVLRLGLDAFAAKMAEVGADGVILSDLPPEEAGAWKAAADRNGVATLFLLAPTSTPERIKSVAESMSSGFVYCVSRTGVTGARSDVPVDLAGLIEQIKKQTSLPICVGFGVSTAEHVRRIGALCDGVVIGSALVDQLHRLANDTDCMTEVQRLVSAWKAGTIPEPIHVHA